MAPGSRSHQTQFPTVLRRRQGHLGMTTHTNRTITIVTRGEVTDAHRHTRGDKVATATGDIDNLRDTTVRPTDRIEIFGTDELSTNVTLVTTRSHRGTAETQGNDRGVMNAIAIATGPMDVTHQTRYLFLTNTGKYRVAKEPTNDKGNIDCIPTCVWLLDANVWPAKRSCAHGNSIQRTTPRKPKLYCIHAVCVCRHAPRFVDHQRSC